MSEEAGILRIAIGTLALTMIAVPLVAYGVSGMDQPVAREAGALAQTATPLSQDEVLALARGQGMARLSDISFENNVWRIIGETRGGFPMALNISSTGQVLNPTS